MCPVNPQLQASLQHGCALHSCPLRSCLSSDCLSNSCLLQDCASHRCTLPAQLPQHLCSLTHCTRLHCLPQGQTHWLQASRCRTQMRAHHAVMSACMQPLWEHCRMLVDTTGSMQLLAQWLHPLRLYDPLRLLLPIRHKFRPGYTHGSLCVGTYRMDMTDSHC